MRDDERETLLALLDGWELGFAVGAADEGSSDLFLERLLPRQRFSFWLSDRF